MRFWERLRTPKVRWEWDFSDDNPYCVKPVGSPRAVKYGWRQIRKVRNPLTADQRAYWAARVRRGTA